MEKMKLSGILGGGPVYMDRVSSIPELKSSGFTMVEVWTIHIEPNGDIGFNAEFDIVKDGEYIGGSKYPFFKADIASLKTSPTSIRKINFGLSAYGSETFNNIRDLINAGGTGKDSILYRNFQTLKREFPDVDAINFDDELTYDVESVTTFALMLADLGFRISICPYTEKDFWNQLVFNIEKLRPGAMDAVYLQCYDGGNDNNPADWDFGDIPVYPGLDSNIGTENIKKQLRNWRKYCRINGGWIWLYDQVKGDADKYAHAIDNCFV